MGLIHALKGDSGEMGFGGNNGLTDFKDILGFDLQSDGTRIGLFLASAIALALGYLVCRYIVGSRLGRVAVAIRDAESRTRFLGYRVERARSTFPRSASSTRANSRRSTPSSWSFVMDVITGKTRPNEGTVFFGQKIDRLGMSESEIAEAGIGRKLQKPTVFEHQSVLGNLELAMAGDKDVFSTLVAKLSSEQQDRIDAVLDLVGLEASVYREADSLPHGHQRRGILKGVSRDEEQILAGYSPTVDWGEQSTLSSQYRNFARKPC